MDKFLKKINHIIQHENNAVKLTIAKFIIDNQQFILDNDTSEIAKKCHVSNSSIIRFCQSLGLEGLNELKFVLKAKKHVLSDINLKFEDSMEMYNNIKNEAANFLSKSWVLQKNEITQLFNKEINVYIFCFNVAFFASKGFVQRMRGIGFKIFLEDDISSIQWYLDNIKGQDLVIFITLSGHNYLLESFAKTVHKKCNTLAILGEKSTFKNHVDEVFIIDNRESDFWDFYSIRSQTLQQFWDFLYLQLNN